jgi:hypothetical protein
LWWDRIFIIDETGHAGVFRSRLLGGTQRSDEAGEPESTGEPTTGEPTPHT